MIDNKITLLYITITQTFLLFIYLDFLHKH